MPKSTNNRFIIKPDGKWLAAPLTVIIAPRFVTGISSRYYSDYDESLKCYIKEREYDQMLAAFNEVVGKMWPCPLSLALGYLFCPFTLGLSLLLPNICVADAEKALEAQIEYYN